MKIVFHPFVINDQKSWGSRVLTKKNRSKTLKFYYLILQTNYLVLKNKLQVANWPVLTMGDLEINFYGHQTIISWKKNNGFFLSTSNLLNKPSVFQRVKWFIHEETIEQKLPELYYCFIKTKMGTSFCFQQRQKQRQVNY